ncbi:MAG: MASE3 domain-containing protein [Desulfobacterales bacterium]
MLLQQKIKTNLQILIIWSLLCIGLYLTSLYSFVLFHIVAECFSIVIAVSIFMIAWNTRQLAKNNYVLFLGIAFLFAGLIDFVHTLTYKGMGIFQGFDANLPTQLWIIARYLQSLSLLAAPWFIDRKLNIHVIMGFYLAVTILLLAAVFSSTLFPDCFIEGKGLTHFKIVSEYIICLILIASLVLLLRHRQKFDQVILRLIIWSILFTIVSELAFTFYISVYGLSNLIGHYFKILSFYLVYRAIIVTGLENPYRLLFYDLEKNKEELQTILDASPTMIFYKDSKNRFIRVNRALAEVMGLTREGIEGKTAFEIYPNQATGYLEDDKEVIASGKSKTGIIEPIDTKIGIRWLQTDKIPYRDMNGSIIGIIGFSIDITRRRQVEEELRVSEEKYRLVVENAAEAILIAQDGLLKYVNPVAVKILGYSEKELTSMPFVKLLHPEDIKKVFEAHMSVMRGEENQPVRQFRVVSLDGTVRWVDSRAVVISYEGKPATVNFITDITERIKTEKALQESEERYRSFVENASDIVFRTDDSGHFIFINPAGLHITGYEEEELIGTHYPVLISPEMCEETLKFFGRQFVKMIPNTYFEYSINAKDGHEIWLGQNTQLIIEDDRVVGFQAVARDITERKRMEEKILALSVTDQLTGLYNRRGFLFHAEQQFKLSDRNKSGLLLFYADLDLLKWINDTMGHEEGDKALIEAANVFKDTFRTSDIIARLGGDEYAALIVDITGTNSEILTARLQNLIDIWNNQENRKYKLSISIGCAYYDPEKPCSIDDLIARADKLMYEQKQSKKNLLMKNGLYFNK